MTDYFADVKLYDAGADQAVVDKIVRHLGIALRNRDSSMVSTSDAQEMGRVKTGWCTKKLGLDEAKADAAINATIAAMKGDRTKSRVTFYYLIAKHAGKLDAV